MPRAKRDEPLEPRSVRLTDKEYEKFRAIGGTEWLRMTLRRMRPATARRVARDAAIIADHKNGMTDIAISEKFGIDRATVWRARQ